MSFALRPYQEEMINSTRVALRNHRAVLVQLPTGGGKTAMASYMLGSASSKGHLGWFNVHRRELIDQSVKTFQKVGFPYGVIAADYSADPMARVQICSVQTLARRIGKIREPRLIVWDECHHIAAGSWSKIFKAFPNAKHVGLSATPARLDGRGLDDHFDEMVCGPTMQELQRQGHLVPFKIYAPGTPDTSGLHTRMGDFNRQETDDLMDQSSIIGNAVKHYQKYAGGERAIVFCVSIKHSEHVVAEYRANGIPAAHVDANTPRHERAQIMEWFRRGDLRVLSNVDLFGEGVDVPDCRVVQMLRPTQSLGLYLQQVGRASRPAPGKSHALILDHAGNVMRHGLPDDDREWTLEGREKGTRRQDSADTIPVRQCDSCYYIMPSMVRTCPECGKEFLIEGRQVNEVDGELVEIDPAQLRRERAREQSQARTLDDLIDLGRKRGYKSPEKWAAHVYTARRRSPAHV